MKKAGDEPTADRQKQQDDYTLRHLATHLYASGQHTKLYTLLVGSKSWMAAKYERFNNDSGYVADLELALSTFSDPIPSEQIIPFLQLHTALRVVYQRSSVYEDIDLKTLIYLDRLEQASTVARFRLHSDLRFRGLMTVYSTLHDLGIRDIALLRDATWVLKDYPTYPSHINKDNATVELITAFAQEGYYSEAIELHTTLKYQNNGMRSIGEIAAALAEAGHLSDAFEVLSNGDSTSRHYALHRVLTAQAKAGSWDEAIAYMRTLDDKNPRSEAYVLCKIALEIYRNGSIDRAKSIWSNLRSSANDMDQFDRLSLICQIGESYQEVGRMDRAREYYEEARELALAQNALRPHEKSIILITIIDSLLRTKTDIDLVDDLISAVFENSRDIKSKNGKNIVERIINILAQAGNIDKALHIVETHIHETENRVLALCSIAVALELPRQEQLFHQLLKKLMDEAHSITQQETRFTALREVACLLAKSGFKKEATSVLDEILQHALTIADPEELSLSYMGFAHALTHIREFNKAIEIAQQAPHEPAMAATLRNTVYGLVDAKKLDIAFEVALGMPEGNAARMEALRDVARGFARNGRIDEAITLRDDLQQGVYNWITDISPHITQDLAETGQSDRALSVARSAPSIEGKIASLRTVASTMVRQGQKKKGLLIREETHQLIPTIEDIHKRAVELANLAYYSEAREVADSIQPSGNKNSMLHDIAIALCQSNRIGDALEIARDQLREEQQLTVLREVGYKLYQQGRDSEAAAIFDEIFDSIRRNFDAVRDSNSIIELVRTLAKCNMFEQAIEVYAILPETFRNKRDAALRDLIPELVRQNRLVYALSLVETRNLSSFLYVISYCCPAIEQLKARSTLKILDATARIASWVRPDWSKAHLLLADQEYRNMTPSICTP